MSAFDRIVEDIAALRQKVAAERTTLRLGTVQDDGTVLLADGAAVTPAASTVVLVDEDRVLVAQHGRRFYVLGVVQ